MMRRSAQLLGIPLMVAMLGGCTHMVGQSFDLGAFQQNIQRGQTTEAEVRQWLGDPAATGIIVDPDGTEARRWIYYHGQVTLPGGRDGRLELLEIRFNEQGVVTAYNWTAGE